MVKSLKKKEKPKVDEKQTKISFFFENKPAKTCDSKLFTNVSSLPEKKPTKASLSNKCADRLNQGGSHGKHSVKSHVEDNSLVINIDDEDSDLNSENSNDIKDKMLLTEDTHASNHSSTLQSSSNKSITSITATEKIDILSGESFQTPTKANPLKARPYSEVESSPDIICETPDAERVMKDASFRNKKKNAYTRSFLSSPDLVSVQPGLKPAHLRTLVGKKCRKIQGAVSISFNKVSPNKTNEPLSSCCNETYNTTTNACVAEAVSNNSSTFQTGAICDTGKQNNFSIPETQVLFDDSFTASQSFIGVEMVGDKQKQESNFQPFKFECNTDESDTSKTKPVENKDGGRFKSKLINALESADSKEEEIAESKWLNERLLKHFTNDMFSCASKSEETNKKSDTTPVKIYPGSKLTIKRQAKTGLSPCSKRLPLAGVNNVLNSPETSAADLVHKAKKSLYLDGDKVVSETFETKDKCSKFTKQRAYAFGYKEKNDSTSSAKSVTLADDDLLADLLCKLDPPVQQSETKTTKPIPVNHRSNRTADLENRPKPIFNKKMLSGNASKPMQCEDEMLNKLFGKEIDEEIIENEDFDFTTKDNPSLPQENSLTTRDKMSVGDGNSGEPIVIEDSEEVLEIIEDLTDSRLTEVLSSSMCIKMSDSFGEELNKEMHKESVKEFKFIDLWQRFTILDVVWNGNSELHLILLSSKNGQQSKCILKGFWLDVHVTKTDIVNIIGEFNSGTCVIDDKNGLLIVNPDVLLSGTLVVSSVFCARKSVLNEKFKGIDKGNIQMLYGSIIHSLFQRIMKERIRTDVDVLELAKSLLMSNKFLHEMYDNNVEEKVVLEEIKNYIPSIFDWLKKHTLWSGGKKSDVIVTEIHDIEENIWSPRFGIKGKIDMTVKVKVKFKICFKNEQVKVVPLELKTGKASFSAEHKGQVTLYSMMYSDRREDPEEGLLLYLKTGQMESVPAKPESKSGLIQLRNQMVHYLTQQVQQTNSPENEVQFSLGQMPEPINRQKVCCNCPHLLNCSIYQRSVESRSLPVDHAMTTLVPETLAHLTQEDLDYFKFWILCLDMESTKKDLRKIWSMSSIEREKAGDCLSNLIISHSELGIAESQSFNEGKGCSLTFKRDNSASGPPLNTVGLNTGEMVVISSEDGRFIALATGFIRKVSQCLVEVIVDRDYLHDTTSFADIKFRLDRNDSFSAAEYLYTNLSKLMEPSPRSKRLRELIIMKSKPQFDLKISKSWVEKVKPVFKKLNKPQKAAILKVLMAKDYILIKGFPGTGKTSTIVALVKILQQLGLSVLLTSYTHSAVDNILMKLKEDDVRFLRLGRRGRIHPSILPHCAEILTSDPSINSVQKLKEFYDSFDIVATSCLGINHAIFKQRSFDVCIVDEASQVLQPACLGPLYHCKKFVLVGDPKQLPPVVKSKDARQLGMDESMFARLDGCGATYNLCLQYRMNRCIMEASNKLVYQGQLQCGNEIVSEQCIQLDLNSIQSCPSWVKEVLDPKLERSVVFLDVTSNESQEFSDGKGFVNTFEADLVLSLLQNLSQASVKLDSVGVISPYRSQVNLLQFKVQTDPQLMDAEVNTVDQYQGRDKSVIIVSFVRTQTENAGELLKDVRRLNVAITRAKHKLILIGSAKTLKTYDHLLVLLTWLEEQNNIIKYQSQ
ncbi:DNA replication ATP-dependent helicase/nuclease DNA2-like [Physella acuta]|uniref:DNA replication ATP-dependent helicase/nuclease DNA2-like n=1 Tax=Physella acuta TaxID=109671 RepID=UPI0027DB12DB|nr:DNA replication ATP-dependent helicase/nuclease DNA2-like [Physella acuta]